MKTSSAKTSQGWGRLALVLVSILLFLVFAVSGGLKLVDPARFLLDVQAFEIFPFSIAFFAALLVPWLEILCAIALLFRKAASAAAVILGALTVSFIALIAYAWTGGLDLDCGCFGDWLVFPNFPSHIAFNAFLLFLLVFILVARWPGRRRI